MSLQQISRISISEQVLRQLQEEILWGTWTAGSRIPSENQLSERLDVSRVSVRQALQKLKQMGFIETRAGEGSFVCKQLTPALMNRSMSLPDDLRVSLKNMLEYRKLTEGAIVQQAIANATPEDIAHLQGLLEQMQQCRDNEKKFVSVDFEFHQYMAQMIKNPLIDYINTICNQLFIEIWKDIVLYTGISKGIAEHTQILECFQNRDGLRCSILVKQHCEATYRIILEKDAAKLQADTLL